MWTVLQRLIKDDEEFIQEKEIRLISNSLRQWRIYIDTFRTRLYPAQFSSFSCTFWKIWINNMSPYLWGWWAPLKKSHADWVGFHNSAAGLQWVYWFVGECFNAPTLFFLENFGKTTLTFCLNEDVPSALGGWTSFRFISLFTTGRRKADIFVQVILTYSRK